MRSLFRTNAFVSRLDHWCALPGLLVRNRQARGFHRNHPFRRRPCRGAFRRAQSSL